jgi:hypothetical protein
MSSAEISDEMRRAQAVFHQYINAASVDDLRRRSNGTRWTNRQLLFHMLFGYIIVRTLMPLVHALGRLRYSSRAWPSPCTSRPRGIPTSSPL